MAFIEITPENIIINEKDSKIKYYLINFEYEERIIQSDIALWQY